MHWNMSVVKYMEFGDYGRGTLFLYTPLKKQFLPS
jgi:hypothetical protein